MVYSQSEVIAFNGMFGEIPRYVRCGLKLNPATLLSDFLVFEAMECVICMDTIFPCHEFNESECYPMRHMSHLHCFNAYLRTQRGLEPTRCPVCRQVVISDEIWYDIASIFGFDASAYVDVEQLPREAQRYARSFQRGEITQRDLRTRAESSYESTQI